jgi:addiction module HigA family antidote
MTRRDPSHPGGLIRDNIDDTGLSIARAAEHLGVTRQQLNKVVTGKSSISPEMAVRLELAFGGTADAWLRAQNAYDLAQARKLITDIHRIEPKQPMRA